MDNYEIVRTAILEKQQIIATYNGYRREMCPHVIGEKNGRAQALFLQFGGKSSSGLSPDPTESALRRTPAEFAAPGDTFPPLDRVPGKPSDSGGSGPPVLVDVIGKDPLVIPAGIPPGAAALDLTDLPSCIAPQANVELPISGTFEFTAAP